MERLFATIVVAFCEYKMADAGLKHHLFTWKEASRTTVTWMQRSIRGCPKTWNPRLSLSDGEHLKRTRTGNPSAQSPATASADPYVPKLRPRNLGALYL